MIAGPIPLADLTPDHLRGVARVRAHDPRSPGFNARFNLYPGREVSDDVLEVWIDCGRLDEDLATLRAVIWAALSTDS